MKILAAPRTILACATTAALCLAFAASLWALSSPRPLTQEARTAVIVVAPPQDLDALSDGAIETQSDWAYYLNEFVRDSGLAHVRMMSKAELSEVFRSHSPIDEDYATIFMKGDRAFYCEGQLFEPFVYELGLKKLDDPNADAGYEGVLKPFRFELAEGVFDPMAGPQN